MLFGMLVALSGYASVRDTPFKQDVAVRIPLAPELAGAQFTKLAVTGDGIVYVLTSAGVARVYDRQLALDRSFRPLAGKKPRDIFQANQNLYYLYEDRWLSNDDTGKPQGLLPSNEFRQLAVSRQGTVLTAGATVCLLYDSKGRQPLGLPEELKVVPYRVYADGTRFYLLSDRSIYAWDGQWKSIHQGTNLTCLAFRDAEILVGTQDGFYGIDHLSGQTITPPQTWLPVTSITCIRPVSDGLWVGTSRGLFFQRSRPAASPALPDGPHGIRYYASQRWLVDDQVLDLDLDLDPEGHLWALTRTGLNKIEFRLMTLAEKAEYFDRKIRQRHIRFGFSAERRLPVAGDIASGEMIDTDNDGGWSSNYLAGQAFRYAVTRNEKARQNAWQTFAALERLQSINPL